MVIEFVQRADSSTSKRGDHMVGAWFDSTNVSKHNTLMGKMIQMVEDRNNQSLTVDNIKPSLDFSGWVLVNHHHPEIVTLRNPLNKPGILLSYAPINVEGLSVYQSAIDYTDDITAFYTASGDLEKDAAVLTLFAPNSKLHRLTSEQNLLVFHGGRKVLTTGATYKISWDSFGVCIEEINDSDRAIAMLNLIDLMHEPKQ